MPRDRQQPCQETSFYGAVAFFVILAAFPFYWMLITAFKTNADLYNVSQYSLLVQRSADAGALPLSVRDRPCSRRWLLNSLIIGVCVVAITLVTALPAGYSLARMGGRNGEALGIGIFLTYLVPTTLLFLPLSRVITDLGLAEFDVGAGRGLSDLHHPVLHLAADGLLQDGAARDRGGGDRRRLQPVRQLSSRWCCRCRCPAS